MRNIFVFLCIALFGFASVAAERSARLSSTDNRGKQTLGFTVMLFGFGPSPASQTNGLSGVFVLNESNLLVIEATKGKWYDQGSGIFYSGLYHSQYDRYKVDTKSLGLHWKHFAGNSFYFRTGVDYRTVKFHYDDIDENNISDTDLNFSGKSVAFNFLIGNQWQFENFNIGCDWFGISIPMSHEIEDEQNQYGSSYSGGQYADDKEKLLESNVMNAIRFYIGANF